jgi:PKD repeat protein
VADKLVTIAQFTDSSQASLAKQLLADFGIESVLTGQNAANIYTIPALATISLQTFENQAQQAQEVLESRKKQEH